MGGAKADDSLEISKYVLGNGIADYVLTGGVTGQLFLAAKGVDFGKGNMALSCQERTHRLNPRHKSANGSVWRKSCCSN